MTGTADERPLLDADRLAEGLVEAPDLTLELLPESPSTNQVAAERARDGGPDGLLVVADHQTSGRGRLDRGWESPAGTAVTFSLLLRPDAPPSAWPWLPLLTGHAVAKALAAWEYDARVKWPNDVLVDGLKVAGILVERVDTPEGPAAVIGVGINVALRADELPVPTAGSLSLAHPDGAPDREDVLLRVATTLRERYDAWRAGGPEGQQRLAASYVASCATIGQQVRVDLPGGSSLSGRAVDVDADGRLVVQTQQGTERVAAGDVVHVRPEPD